MWAKKRTSSKIGHLFFLFQWEPIPYFNNKIICDLVEQKHKGIISILVRTELVLLKTPTCALLRWSIIIIFSFNYVLGVHYSECRQIDIVIKDPED